MRTKDFGLRFDSRQTIDKDEQNKAKTQMNSDATDVALFVRTSDEEIQKWDKKRIYETLIRETDIHSDAAIIIATEVEKLIANLNIEFLTAPLIRELTNAKLVEYNLERIRRQHTRLGVPLYDVRTMILNANKENANVPHGPEATNMRLAEQIKKD